MNAIDSQIEHDTAETMKMLGIPWVNNLGSTGRGSYADFTGLRAIQSGLAAKVEPWLDDLVREDA